MGDGKLSGDMGTARVESGQLEASAPVHDDYDVETVERVYRFVLCQSSLGWLFADLHLCQQETRSAHNSR